MPDSRQSLQLQQFESALTRALEYFFLEHIFAKYNIPYPLQDWAYAAFEAGEFEKILTHPQLAEHFNKQNQDLHAYWNKYKNTRYESFAKYILKHARTSSTNIEIASLIEKFFTA